MRRVITKIKIILTLIFCVYFLASCSAINHMSREKKDVSPYEYGLRSATTGVERYQVLLKTHQVAVASGVNVDYSRIDTIRIEIPAKPMRIPLTQYNDFKDCVIVVKNTVENCWLFGVEEKEIPIEVPKQAIDAGDFRSVESLKRGCYLLMIEDASPWVQNRKGHEYGHQRKDILLVGNGLAENSVTMPYNNGNSTPKCSYIKVKDEPLVLKNLTIKRDSGCTKVTHVAVISGYNNVRITNVSLYTPASTLTDDRGICINNCTNVTLNNVRIDGTYSLPNHSGYGVNINNVWNFKAIRMYGKANWGVFGNNNVNTARIEDSQINRFDIHCYGRNISFKNVDFFDLYNQYSSVYGTISYEKCTFTDFVPVLNGGSYNSYVGHEVVFKDCVFNATPKKNSLFKFSHMDEPTNVRNELGEKCLPNVKIYNMTVNMTGGVKDLFMFKCSAGGNNLTDIGYLSIISIDGLSINSDVDNPLKSFSLSNITIQTKNEVDCQMKDVIINQPKGVDTKASQGEVVVLKTNMPIKGGRVTMKNATGISQ